MVHYGGATQLTVPMEEKNIWEDMPKQRTIIFNFLVKERDNDRRKNVSFSIGPKGSWFARIGENVAYHALPTSLEDHINERKAKDIYLRHVTLGLHGSFVAMWSDGTESWSLSEGYVGVLKALKARRRIDSVVLNPYKDNEYVIVEDDGCINWRLSSDNKAYGPVVNDFVAYMERRAREDGSTFNITSTG